ncbi:MAG: hypothetical protein ACRDA5_04800 [Clostridium sp.]
MSYILNEDIMWVMLYKNRYGFIYKSIEDYNLTCDNRKLDKYIESKYKDGFNIDSGEVVSIIADIINSNYINKDTLMEKEYKDKLDENESRFITEINVQNEIILKVNRYKENKKKFEEIINDENIKLLNGFEKIYKHFNQTMERVHEKGEKNIHERTASKIVDLVHSFKHNLYNYFTNKITGLISLSCNLKIEELVGKSIINELDNLEDNISNYAFEKYIDESKWKFIIESAKMIALECIEILKKYELELCITIKCRLIDNIKKENLRLQTTLLELEKIRKDRVVIEEKLNILKSREKDFREKNKQHNDCNEFKKIIKANYVTEYNKIIELINNENTENNEIRTYFEYLYLITSEMNYLEEIIFG